MSMKSREVQSVFPDRDLCKLLFPDVFVLLARVLMVAIN